MRCVKSVQMNEESFRFFRLRVNCGEEIEWSAVDYSSGEIPVLLGAEYSGFFSPGDIIDGFLYGFAPMRLRVVGLLDDGSAVFLNDEYGLDHSLDTSIVIPYPPILGRSKVGNDELFPTLASMMIWGFLSPSSGEKDDAVAVLDSAAAKSGFHDYEMMMENSYAIQNSYLRQLVKENRLLLGAIIVLLFSVVSFVVLQLDKLSVATKENRLLIRKNLGYGERAIVRDESWILFVEEVLFAVISFSIYCSQLYREPFSFFVCAATLLCFLVVDAAVQRKLFRVVLREA